MPFNYIYKSGLQNLTLMKNFLNYIIITSAKEQPNNTVTYIVVTYFLPDNKKAGGRYVTVSGKVKKLDGMKCAIIMINGTKIPIGDVQYIDGDMFRLFE